LSRTKEEEKKGKKEEGGRGENFARGSVSHREEKKKGVGLRFRNFYNCKTDSKTDSPLFALSQS